MGCSSKLTSAEKPRVLGHLLSSHLGADEVNVPSARKGIFE